MPWKDPFAVVELGLRSILSMADVVLVSGLGLGSGLGNLLGVDHLLSVKLFAGVVPHQS